MWERFGNLWGGGGGWGDIVSLHISTQLLLKQKCQLNTVLSLVMKCCFSSFNIWCSKIYIRVVQFIYCYYRNTSYFVFYVATGECLDDIILFCRVVYLFVCVF